MKKTVWGLLWSSFSAVLPSWVGVVVAIILSFIAWKTSPNNLIPVYWLVVIVIVAILVIAICLKATNTAFEEYQNLKNNYQNLENEYQNLKNNYQNLKRNQIPKILQVRWDKNMNLILCIFENSDLFATEQRITFYYTDDYGLESAIAVGYIKTIQSNGNIQAVIDHPDSTYQDIIDGLASNDSKIKENTIVRPGVIKNFYQP
jgi:hypothetical protein